jgi:hypothetical protein
LQRAREAGTPACVERDPNVGRCTPQQCAQPKRVRTEYDDDGCIGAEPFARDEHGVQQQGLSAAPNELLRSAKPARPACGEKHARETRATSCYSAHHVATILEP